jgi:hypothetical protein
MSRAYSDYSGLMPANLITLAHFSISSSISFPKSAGEPMSLRRARWPGARQRPLPDAEIGDVES